MSTIERLPMPRRSESPHYWGRAQAAPAPVALLPFLEHLLLFALFSACAGFWFAVIWWIVG